MQLKHMVMLALLAVGCGAQDEGYPEDAPGLRLEDDPSYVYEGFDEGETIVGVLYADDLEQMTDDTDAEIGSVQQAFSSAAQFGMWTSAGPNATEQRCPQTWSTGRCEMPSSKFISLKNDLPQPPWPAVNFHAAMDSATSTMDAVVPFGWNVAACPTCGVAGQGEVYGTVFKKTAAEITSICGASSIACAGHHHATNFTAFGLAYTKYAGCNIYFSDTLLQGAATNVLKHEIGHCLGLGHTAQYGSTYIMAYNGGFGTLNSQDVALLNAYTP